MIYSDLSVKIYSAEIRFSVYKKGTGGEGCSSSPVKVFPYFPKCQFQFLSCAKITPSHPSYKWTGYLGKVIQGSLWPDMRGPTLLSHVLMYPVQLLLATETNIP